MNPHLHSFRDDLKAALRGEALTVVYDPVGELQRSGLPQLEPWRPPSGGGLCQRHHSPATLNLALLKRSSVVGVDWGGAMRADPTLNPASLRACAPSWRVER